MENKKEKKKYVCKKRNFLIWPNHVYHLAIYSTCVWAGDWRGFLVAYIQIQFWKQEST